MVVCRFWQQGDCKRGDSCRFEHPGSDRAQYNGYSRPDRQQDRQPVFNPPRGPREKDRYEPRQAERYQGNRYDQQNHGRFDTRHRYDQQRNNEEDRREQQRLRVFNVNDLPWGLDRNSIREDLTKELPMWPLSCYAPTRRVPKQLMGGPAIEQSPEEIRMQYYLAKAQGNEQAAAQNEFQLAQNATSQIQNILKDLNGACKYLWNGQHEHPNRDDIAEGVNRHVTVDPRKPQQQQGRANPFAQPLPLEKTRINPFAASEKPNPFLQPQPANPFGQPSGFSSGVSTGALPFAQQPQGPKANPFLQPNGTVPSASSSFSQPAVPSGQNPFAQPAPSQATPFAEQARSTAAFGQPANEPNAFTPSKLQPQAVGFTQPSQPASSHSLNPAAAAQNPFGAPPALSNGFQTSPTPASRANSGRPARKPGASPFFSGDTQPFPAGNETTAPESDYGPAGSEDRKRIEDAYRKAKSTGIFETEIPEVPPLNEWVDFNF